MGLFVVDLEKPKTTRSKVKAAIGNLELYLVESENNVGYEYLLDIASGYLEQAINKEDE